MTITMTIKSDGNYSAQGSPPPGRQIRAIVNEQEFTATHMYELASQISEALEEGQEITVGVEVSDINTDTPETP